MNCSLLAAFSRLARFAPLLLATFGLGCIGKVIEYEGEKGSFGSCVTWEFNSMHIDLRVGQVTTGGGCVWITDNNPACARMTECTISCTSDANGNGVADPGESQISQSGKLGPGSWYACFDSTTADAGVSFFSNSLVIDMEVKFADGSGVSCVHRHAPAAGASKHIPLIGPASTWNVAQGVICRMTQEGLKLRFEGAEEVDSRTYDPRTPIGLRVLAQGVPVGEAWNSGSGALVVEVPISAFLVLGDGIQSVSQSTRELGSRPVSIEVYDASGLILSRTVGGTWWY